MPPRKDFDDKRSAKKKSDLSKVDKKSRNALKKNKKEVQDALDNHNLGWQTRDGKRI